MQSMLLADLSTLAARLDGVSERRRDGLLDWRYHGRLVARQLDRSHIVIRSSFDSRDFLIDHGNAEAIEDAVIGAWELQSGK
jgi:hypothetical protein